MKHLHTLILTISLLLLASCNSDEPEFSSSQIQTALSGMKGTYTGSVSASFYQGDDISKSDDGRFVSGDSLTIFVDLTPMATTIADEAIASRLRELGTVTVKAAYEFYQMEADFYAFVLRPDDYVFDAGEGIDAPVRIVFSQNFGGDADTQAYHKSMMFNLSPKELWIDGEKYEPFRQLVYHYGGNLE